MRIRVLPAEIMPFKHYTLGVMETACDVFSDARLPKITLRKTVEWLGAGHPHYSTLHGWIGGCGSRVLGLQDKDAGIPVSALIADADRRHGGELFKLWGQPCSVSPVKYRSNKRFEQLEACARVFSIARHIFPESTYSLCEWEKELREDFHVAAWSFSCRVSCTTFQQHVPGGCELEFALLTKKPQSTGKEKNHGARSPP